MALYYDDRSRLLRRNHQALLKDINNSPGITFTELIQKGWSYGAFSATLRDLKKRRFIEETRKDEPTDGRPRIGLSLSPKGYAVHLLMESIADVVESDSIESYHSGFCEYLCMIGKSGQATPEHVLKMCKAYIKDYERRQEA